MGVSLRGGDWRTFSNGRFNIPESTFWPLGIILTGMIVRLAAAFWGNIFQQPLLLRGVRFITIINVISAGVLALELANRDLFTTKSVFGLIWLFMSCIQVGAIYGACKTANPLGERFRATFLVTNILSLMAFIAVLVHGMFWGIVKYLEQICFCQDFHLL